MTRKQVERVVRVWQNRLKLSHWELVVDWEKPVSDEAHATTWRLNTYDRAEIRFSPEFVNWTSEFLNKTVVHELLHLHTRDLDRAFAAAEEHMPAEAYRALDKRYDHEIEGAVDRIACAIVAVGGLA